MKRHRHRYEFNNKSLGTGISRSRIDIKGTSPDERLGEVA